MPYEVVKSGNKWLTKNKATGEVKGTHASREKAMSQMRLLYSLEGSQKK